MDGRDIGTKVFPNAKIKFFITADLLERANRRHEQLMNKNISFEEVYNNLKIRDYEDSNRKINPLVKAIDAIEIDNTKMSLEQQNNLIFEIIDKKINENHNR